MHSESASCELAEAVGLVLEPPQAAIATAQHKVASAAETAVSLVPAALLMIALSSS